VRRNQTNPGQWAPDGMAFPNLACAYTSSTRLTGVMVESIGDRASDIVAPI
jgi:hypothetical protein